MQKELEELTEHCCSIRTTSDYPVLRVTVATRLCVWAHALNMVYTLIRQPDLASRSTCLLCQDPDINPPTRNLPHDPHYNFAYTA